jgi:HAD superfamily hydrolase (TIGR01549 family)
VAALGVDDAGLAAGLAAGYERAQRAGHPLIDGAADAVRAASQRFKLGLLTNGPADIQRLKIEQSGLAEYFDAVVISGEAGVGKPNPEAFSRIVDALGATVEETVMVGDSWQRDVQGARRTGIRPIWISNGRPPPEHSAQVATLPSIAALSSFPLG